ncbi:hypothetical protein GGR57DRAFT_470217 [Xylariaceae sp. FL1272]|nr:hypothetical protein GGR57DRAFT_470217 [Xylariaceae sp. FL1272]
MSWKQLSEGRWERPVDGLEGYFVAVADTSAKLCGGREHYTLYSVVTLDCLNTEDAVRQAWKRIRFEQPQIATTIEGEKKVYEVPDEAALEKWLLSTFIVSSSVNFKQLYSSATPVKQATLYYLQNSSELAIRAPHHTIDGVGLLRFWHCFFHALNSPIEDNELRWGDEPPRLAPSLSTALSLPRAAQEAEEKAVSMFAEWAQNTPGVGPVSRFGAAEAGLGQCQNTELVLSLENTKEIINFCRGKGLTVTALVHAAYIQAIVKHADPESKRDKYVSSTQFNLRSYLPHPYDSEKYAVAVFYSPQVYLIDLPASFTDLAESLHRHYHTSFKGNPEALKLTGPLHGELCKFARSPYLVSAPAARDATTSSFGVVEKHMEREYGNIRIADIKAGADIVLGSSMFFQYTFRDQLRLVYAFNDGHEEAKDIQKYLKEVEAVLVNELRS